MLFHALSVSFWQPVTVALPVTSPLLEAQSHMVLPTLSQHDLLLISAVLSPFNMGSSHSGLMTRILSSLPMVSPLQQ